MSLLIEVRAHVAWARPLLSQSNYRKGLTNSVTSNYHNNSGGGWGSQELLDVSGIDSLIVSFNFKQA